MNRTISDTMLLKLSEFIENKLALSFTEERWDDLERNIKAAALEFGYPDVSSYLQNILNNPMNRRQAEQLASYLTINETYFWREPLSFEALENIIIPEMVEKKRNDDKRLRIWSAGCSGGEEPYSIAIAITKTIPDYQNWNISILATDINPRILAKANEGIYGSWSFRKVPQGFQERYFRKVSQNKFEIIPKIKKMVSFEYLNLAEDEYPSPLNNTNAMDIIFCRNVLMYFNQKRFRQVVDGLSRSLLNGGYLLVSSSELSSQNFPGFKPVNLPGIVLYKKSDRKQFFDKSDPFIYPIPDDYSQNLVHEFKESDVHSDEQVLTEGDSKHQEEKIISNDEPILEQVVQIYESGNYAGVIDGFDKKELSEEELMLLIRSYANKGELKRAQELCHIAIGSQKLNAKIHYLCATIHQELNQPDEAISSLKRAIYIDDDFVLPYYNLANLYLKKGNLIDSKKCYQNILSILKKCEDHEIVPESEGLTSGRFREIINATIQTHAL